MELGMVELGRGGRQHERAASLLRRLQSRKQEPFADRLMAIMRHGFGGHVIKAAAGKEKKPA
jgi:hypothetical protein